MPNCPPTPHCPLPPSRRSPPVTQADTQRRGNRHLGTLFGLCVALGALPFAAAAQPTAGGAAAVATPLANLPLELRQAMSRYPVTLYVLPSCDGCEASRQYLKQRGIPYTEKLVGNNDGEVLQRLTGGREVPALSIGNQVLRSFSPDNWASYLDAAGYPRSSRLPSNYVPSAPTPLVAARPAPSTAPAPGPADAPVAAPPPGQGGIRF